ncbi:MAG: trigger factor [Clostridium sp.]|nr:MULTISPECIES: trigger factor [unclassified Clostridium]RHS25503.1 trigger factor [Clostridium sp. AF12-28]RHS29521.1 trigger factor [Clostridium sp. AF12-19]RHT43645.1 trigger factor [Clostridium sp. AM30-24]SCH56653.1 Trigger factor [uncultured Clostridium sp.]
MSVQVENLEKNTAKLTIEVPAEKFEEAVQHSYNKNKGKFNIPGFRKGKAPFNMIKKMYGVGVFYEDAVDEVIDTSYPDAAKESGLEIVSRPSISIEEIEEGKAFVYTAVVAVKPEVTLGEYKGVEVQKTKSEVTEEDIETEIKRAREKNSRLITVEDRGIEDGDQVTIDFDGSVDGKRFEGGKAEDYPLTIGSHTFIDNFEEQLIGKTTGEECEVNVTFPAEYHVEELKNKPAVFKVKVKEIQRKELPEANDDFASEVSDFDTMEEYKKDLTEKLQAEKIEAAKTADEDKVVAKVIENATMEIPDQMVEEQVNGMVNDYARRLESQGISFKQYVEITGMTAEKIGEQMKPQAIKRIQTRLVLEAVVKAENIQADDAAVEEQFDKMAEDFKMDKEQIKGMFGEEQMAQLKEDLAVQKAIDFLVAEAKFVD